MVYPPATYAGPYRSPLSLQHNTTIMGLHAPPTGRALLFSLATSFRNVYDRNRRPRGPSNLSGGSVPEHPQHFCANNLATSTTE